MRPLPIRTKLILAFLAISLIGLLLSALLNLGVTHQALRKTTGQALAGAASQVAAQIDTFIQYNLDTIRTQSLQPALAAYLELPPEIRLQSPAHREVIRILDSFHRQDQVNISSYALFDVRGWCWADTFGTPLQQWKERPYLKEPLETGLPSVSSVLLSWQSGMPSIFFNSPVRSTKGEIVGILRARHNANAVQKIIFEKEGLLGPGSLALLFDENLVRIADSHDRGLIFKPLVPIEGPQLQTLQTENRFVAPLEKGEVLPDLQAGLLGHPSTHSFSARTHPGTGELMLCSSSTLTTRPWTVVFAQPQAVFRNTLRTQIFTSTLLLAAFAAAAMAAGLYLAQTIARPILRLTSFAGRLARGNFHQQVEITSGDEIGELAASFNSMALALEESQQRISANAEHLAVLLDTIPDAVIVHRPDGQISEINQKCSQMFGYSLEEMMSLTIEEISGKGYTQDMAKERLDQVHQVGLLDIEWVSRRKDGSEFPSLVRLRSASLGNESYILAIITDMTERKRLESQLLQASKMEAIGTLAGGIAHDFNNLLMGIQSYVTLMRMDLEESHPHVPMLRNLEEQVNSGAGLTRQLLGYARGGCYELRVLDLNEVLKKTSETFGHTKKEVTIHTDFDPELWSVEADQSQMEQVFVNLFVNAWQAMPGAGDLFLTTKNLFLDETSPPIQSLAPGKYVQVSVTDTGEGIDEAIQGRIFEPFFSTKEKKRGTGLGLASAFGIIKNHGGHISVYSEKGHGATFHIYLPASTKEVQKKTTPTPELKRGRETLLVVDDEAMILDLCKPLLEPLGYQVFLAASGPEALNIYRSRAEQIDLILLDMIMPGMSGAETFEALKTINPKVRVVLASGYSINDQTQRILDRGCIGFIQKPYNLTELSNKIREALATSVA